MYNLHLVQVHVLVYILCNLHLAQPTSVQLTSCTTYIVYSFTAAPGTLAQHTPCTTYIWHGTATKSCDGRGVSE